MPNQAPVRLRMIKANRLTRRQAEALIKALLTVDEEKLFQEQELKSFRFAFDKLTKSWREALEKETGKEKTKKLDNVKSITGSVLYPPKKARKQRPKIAYLRSVNGS